MEHIRQSTLALAAGPKQAASTRPPRSAAVAPHRHGSDGEFLPHPDPTKYNNGVQIAYDHRRVLLSTQRLQVATLCLP